MSFLKVIFKQYLNDIINCDTMRPHSTFTLNISLIDIYTICTEYRMLHIQIRTDVVWM